MEIKCIKDKAVLIKGKKESVLINPNKETLENNGARIAIYSCLSDGVNGHLTENRIVIAGPGEYEVGGIEINGFADGSNGVFYSLKVDGFVIGVVDKLGEELTDKKIEKIDGVDVLLFDVGVAETVGVKSIVQLAKKWGTNYLLPMNTLNQPGALAKFVDESDCEGQESVESLKLIDKESLPDGMEVVLLKS